MGMPLCLGYAEGAFYFAKLRLADDAYPTSRLWRGGRER